MPPDFSRLHSQESSYNETKEDHPPPRSTNQEEDDDEDDLAPSFPQPDEDDEGPETTDNPTFTIIHSTTPLHDIKASVDREVEVQDNGNMKNSSILAKNDVLLSASYPPVENGPNSKRPREITIHTIAIGDQFDVLDSTNRWCEAEVITLTHTANKYLLAITSFLLFIGSKSRSRKPSCLYKLFILGSQI